MANATPSPERPRELPERLDILEERISTVGHLAEALEQRLDPVLRETEASAPDHPSEGWRTTVGTRLGVSAEQIDEIAFRLESILDRLEL